MKKLLSILLAVCMVVSMLTVAAVSVGAAGSSGTKTITGGVIEYLMNEMSTGYKVHYWGGADGAKDADLTATGKTEKRSVGSAYWNGAEQNFVMFTATVPADFSGYKVHNGDRWFGEDGKPDKTTAYIFNYSGDKALYEESAEPVTEATQASTSAVVFENHFYVDFTQVLPNKGTWYAWTWNNGSNGEWRQVERFGYVAAHENVLFALIDGEPSWSNVLAQTEDTVVQNMQKLVVLNEKDDNGHFKTQWVSTEAGTTAPVSEPVTEAPTEPATVVPVTEPATDAPTEPAEKAYYLVGTMNNWTAEEGYKLSKNIASAENEEYLLSGVKLTTKDEFKIVYTDGNAATAVWFPDPGDNYSGIKKDGNYTVYFRPNGDGYEDWYLGVINVIEEVIETEPVTDKPTEPVTDKPTEPVTEPATEVTEIPLDGSFNLVGSINGEEYYGTDYTFADGKVTLDTAAASYVFVKQGETSFMTNGFDPDATEVTLYNVAITGEESDKLMVPAGKSTLTLKAYSDGTFKLSYVLNEAYTEPATDAPTEPAEKAYYLVGTMNNWTAEEGYKLSKNIASAENEEYLLSGVKLTTKDEFKIVYTDGNAATAVWFPDPGDNYSGIKKDGTYTVYFRPNGDGYEDWYLGVINVIEEVIETEPVTDAPTEPVTEEPTTPVGEGGYYIVGTMTEWKVDAAYKLSRNDASADTEEYLFNDLALKTNDEFKVVYSADGTATTIWFPDGANNNYSDIKKDGTYTVYFRPNYDGYEDWFNGCLVVIGKEVPTDPTPTDPTPTEPTPTDPTPTDPTPTEPVADSGYYVVGNMTDWQLDGAYKLAKNEGAEDTEEYTLENLELKPDSEFKVVYTEDGKLDGATWFPDLADNYGANGEITAAGTYTAYFRPHYDGYEDWFNGCIAVINNSEPQPLLGDVDMDGDVDIQDATLLQRCLAEMTALNGDQYKLADVNQDGFVNVRDVTAIIQRIAAEMS